MSMVHVKSLITKLAKLKSEIETEKRALRPDWTRLRHLKKLRLMLKDRLMRLTAASTRSSGGLTARRKAYPPDGRQSA
jgi:uncharacterized protein YdcH (DUF465 family)